MAEQHEKLRKDEIQGQIIHEYDGIEEADNHLPNWWLVTFYGAIVFSFGYWFYYHEYHMGPTTPEAFAAEMAERAGQGEADESTLLVLAGDTRTISEGREVYATTCAACHGANAQGEIGPNLTDNRWLHGGTASAIYHSIRDGITSDQARIPGSAGMPEWRAQLGERRVQAVTAYLLSIRGTNVPGRAAEGDEDDGSGGGEEPQQEAAPAPSGTPTGTEASAPSASPDPGA
jgi:cytochrome c oxidase cbb3-type subunit 3